MMKRLDDLPRNTPGVAYAKKLMKKYVDKDETLKSLGVDCIVLAICARLEEIEITEFPFDENFPSEADLQPHHSNGLGGKLKCNGSNNPLPCYPALLLMYLS